MRDPKYRKHSSRDFAFVEVDGKRIRLPGKHNSPESKTAWHKLCARRREAAGEKAVPVPAEKGLLTVGALAARYLDFCVETAAGNKRCDAANNHGAVLAFLPYAVDMLVVEFGPKRLKDYQTQLSRKFKKRPIHAKPNYQPQRLSLAYVNDCIGRIKGLFRWGVSEELVDPVVYHALLTVPHLKKGKSAARDPKKKQPVPMEHIEPIFDYLHPVTTAMVQLHMLTGVRSRSICLATPEQFDTSKAMWIWRPRHKTESRDIELTVPIGPRCRKVLRPILRRKKAGEYLFDPREVRANKRYRDHYDSCSYYTAVQRAIVRAENGRKKGAASIPRWNPHRLRHTFGTLVNDHYGYEAAQTMLGHESVNVTKLYTARRLKLASQIAAEIG